MLDLYFNEESDYFEENTIDNKVFYSSIPQPFQFECKAEKKCVVMRAMRRN